MNIIAKAQHAYCNTLDMLDAHLSHSIQRKDAEQLASISFFNSIRDNIDGKVKVKLKRGEAGEWEQVVMAEVLLPDTPNSCGDIYSRKAIREFAYEYAMQGYAIDVNHNLLDIKNTKAVVV